MILFGLNHVRQRSYFEPLGVSFFGASPKFRILIHFNPAQKNKPKHRPNKIGIFSKKYHPKGDKIFVSVSNEKTSSPRIS